MCELEGNVMHCEKHEDALKHENHEDLEVNPWMIQSYFDGESKSDEFETLSRDALMETPTWKALSELRSIVRMDSEEVVDSIDSYALLASIQERIERESEQSPHFVRTPRKSSVRSAFVRWMPAIVGAALFFLSIPGLVGLLQKDDEPLKPSTVVYITDSGKNAPYPSVGASSGMREEAESQAVVLPRNALGSSAAFKAQGTQQLTVEELDFALRKLVDRIEMLEKANQKNIETGKASLQTDEPVVPHKL